MSWWETRRAVHGSELGAAALDYVAHGWPVVPGSFRQGTEWRGGECSSGERTGPAGGLPRRATAPAPVAMGGVAAASRDQAQISAWWSGLPYSVLLATGSVLDAIELPAAVGRRVLATLQSMDLAVPAAATPVGQWWFPMAAGEPLRPELASRAEVVLRAAGSWVVAPPSAHSAGGVRWRQEPAACGWQLPDPYEVQYAVLEALHPRRLAAVAGRIGSHAT